MEWGMVGPHFDPDTNDRSADRFDGYSPELHDSGKHQRLMQLAAGSDTPLPTASDLGGVGFDRPTQITDDDRVVRRRRNPRKVALGGKLQDLKRTGHGWVVEQFRDEDKVVPPCPYCDGPMYPVVAWLCECTLEVYTPATDSGCRCNWCVINRGGFQPTAGRPRSHCGTDRCRKAHNAERSRKSYQRRRKQRSLTDTP